MISSEKFGQENAFALLQKKIFIKPAEIWTVMGK